jgi:hypothetical protein
MAVMRRRRRTIEITNGTTSAAGVDASPDVNAQAPPDGEGGGGGKQKKSMSPVWVHSDAPGQVASDGAQRTPHTPTLVHCPSAQSASIEHWEPSAPGLGTG